MNLPRLLTLAALFALATAQLGLALHFWSGFESGDVIGGRLLLVIGAGLSVLEIFMLALADRVGHMKRRGAAVIWFVLFLAVLAIDGAADFGAITTVTAADQSDRARDVLVYQQNQETVERTTADITRLRATITDPDYQKPSAALRSLLEEREQRRAEFEARNQLPPSALTRRIARLESALATTEAIERQEALRDGAQAFLADHRVPSAIHPQFAALATLLSGAGIVVSPEQVRIGLAFVLVVVLKLVLTIGFWVAAGGKPGAGESDGATSLRVRWQSWPFARPKTMLPQVAANYGEAPKKPLPIVRRPPAKRNPWQAPDPKSRRFGPDTQDDFDEFS